MPRREDDDDAAAVGAAPSFDLDLSQCLEVGYVSDELSKLRIHDDEVGDDMQNEAIAHAKQGMNVFLTGEAGTGKSWTSKQIRTQLELAGKKVQVVAPTGIAAVNVGGTTIHMWGGFGKRNPNSNPEPKPELL
jgi:hypothetical protein